MDYTALYLNLYTFLLGKEFDVEYFKTRRTENILAKHAIRKHLRNTGLTYKTIGEIEEGICGTRADHSTIMHSCLQESVYDKQLASYFEHENEVKTADVNRLITYIFSKGEGFNRQLLIENIKKYYIIKVK